MRALNQVGQKIAARQEIAVVGMMVLTLAMMIMPMPPVLADMLIAVNIALSVLLMMAAIHISAPVEFSTLPSLILLTTTFRLSLSITTSRMVLVQGDAGEIIRAFGEFVIAGNVVVGLVVYLIITIVQFMVISKGSERVAEVAARFTLDAMPGKQISIDTDLKNGDIDKDEARRRRSLLGTESQLFGAMDGAMKFVKGDSVASLVIIVINLVGGIVIGSVQRGLPFGDAVRTYSLLAVGDGLIAQIPALLISLTAGLIVTRSGSEAGRNLGQDIVAQIIAQPRTLQVAAVILAVIGLVPGFPTTVFLVLAAIVGGSGWLLAKREVQDSARRFAASAAAERSGAEPARLTVALGERFLAHPEAVAAALDVARRETSERLGLLIPRLRLLPEAIEGAGWRYDIDGIPTEQGEAETTEDVLGALRDCILKTAGRFLGVQETQRMLNGLEADYADLVKEAQKVAPVARLAEVMRRLLNEQVVITNIRSILESCTSWGGIEQNTGMLAERVRIGLRSQICFGVAGLGKVLPVLLIDPALDEEWRSQIQDSTTSLQMRLDEGVVERLSSVLTHYAGQNKRAGASVAIVAPIELRRHIAVELKRYGTMVPILSHGEIAPDFKVEVLGTIQHAWLYPDQQRAKQVPRLVAVGE